MTNLLNKVLDILDNIESIQTVLFDNGNSADVRIDRKPTPAALLYTLPAWNLDISGGVSRENADIQVFFFERAKFDSKSEEKLDIFENTGDMAREFIYKLLNDSSIRVIDDSVKINAVYGEFDAFVCGCTVNITIEEKQPSCIWSEPTPTPDNEQEPEPVENSSQNG